MTSLLKFGSRHGKERSLLALFILHSLGRCPKSGYDLLTEIKEKTGGLWVPSKGTLYPVLHQLEDEHLIEVIATGKRAKTTFAVTENGKDALQTVKEQGRESHRKMALYKNLVLDIFGGAKINAKGLLFDIKTALDELPPGDEHIAVRVLEQCLDDLKRIG
ncbi:MAG: PadR family transcriptional regulator [Methanomicrobiales archaeon]|nr:PadR family transcriptional regulator [Methanomicrobiales archaeon]